MKIKYLSYAQARAMEADYQYLAGLPFNKAFPQEGKVKSVFIAPYSRILQWQYVRSIVKGALQNAIVQSSPDGRFDVLLLSDAAGANGEFEYQNLRDWLAAEGLPFDMGRYKYLRSGS